MRALFGQLENATTRTVGGACAFGLLALGLGLHATGCLVTERVDFSAPNLPPSVTRVRPPPPPFYVLPSVGDPSCPPDQIAFVARIIDYDVNDNLEAVIVINGSPDTIGVQVPLTTARGMDRGEIPICVPRARFTRPCNYVEFLASSSFNVGRPYGTDIPGDLGRTDWNVSGSFNQASADTLSTDCAPIPIVDAGVDGGADGGLPDASP